MDQTGQRFEQLLSQHSEQAYRLLQSPGWQDEEPIHQFRLCMKRLRAGWRLLRGQVLEDQWRAADQHLKAAAQALGGQRDADVRLSSWQRVCKSAPSIPPDTLSRLDDLLHAAAAQSSGKPHRADILAWLDQEAALRAGVALKDYRWCTLVEAMGQSHTKVHALASKALDQGPDAVFHRWRRWVKHLLYQQQMLATAGEQPQSDAAGLLKRLGTELGRKHDLDLLRDWFAQRVTDAGLDTEWRALCPLMQRLDREQVATIGSTYQRWSQAEALTPFSSAAREGCRMSFFKKLEPTNRLDKKAYKNALPELRTQLLAVQEQLKGADFPVLVLISGMDGAGKGESVNLLSEWLDPRYIRTFAFGDPNEEERQRPPFWRFWRALPAAGRIGLYVGSWYSEPLARRVRGQRSDAEWQADLELIRQFEQTLVAEGALVIKIWLYLGCDEQQQRLTKLAGDPHTAWRVSERDWEHLELYDRFRSLAEETLEATSQAGAKWQVVNGADPRSRGLAVGELVRDQLKQRLKKTPPRPDSQPAHARYPRVLEQVDLSQTLDKKSYKHQLELYQGRLNQLVRTHSHRGRNIVMALEGWDAGGKGGLIRRMIAAMDARHYRVIPVAAPTKEELKHHYLWRFWRDLPGAGEVVIFDRSWYGRVLVERIEGFATEEAWQRAYQEICEFEQQLIDQGTLLFKFWLHIDQDEQLARFEARRETPFKQYKLTEEDFRNRTRWEEYEAAVDEMVARTSTSAAPWTLVPGNDKRFARIFALKTLCERLEQAL